jgi:hypothetical protein
MSVNGLVTGLCLWWGIVLSSEIPPLVKGVLQSMTQSVLLIEVQAQAMQVLFVHVQSSSEQQVWMIANPLATLGFRLAA